MIVRVDDFPSGSERGEISPTYREDFARFHAAMDGIPYLLGVVPTFATGDDLAWLHALEGDGVEIACHGITHARGEFDVPLSVCIPHLRRASPLVHTAAFIPPFNHVSAPLLTALRVLGYKLVTTGPETNQSLVRNYAHPLTVVPAPWYGYARTLLQRWHAGERPGTTDCLCLHWTWERNEAYGPLRELVPLIKPLTIPWSSVYPEVFR